jgi:hypothetical protein
MPEKGNPSLEQRLLDLSLIWLVLYNAVFLVDVLSDGAKAGQWAGTIMAFIDERRGWVTLFEAIAAASLFADLVVRFDVYPDSRRSWRVAGVGLALAGLVFKAFTFYLNSAYLE